jgi:hypothetical protein
VTPKLIVLRANVHDYRILLRSSDGSPFRVTGFVDLDPSWRADIGSDASAQQHAVAFHIGSHPQESSREKTVAITTDHAKQKQVSVRVVVLDP